MPYFLLISDTQQKAVDEIKNWLKAVSEVILPQFLREHFQQFSPSDVFIGYHADAPASIYLRFDKNESTDAIVEKAKHIFLECATPDAISRLSETGLDDNEKKKISEIFYNLRKESLADAIDCYSTENRLMQVTTFSRLLTDGAKQMICRKLDLYNDDIQIVTLQQINTEEQFSKRIRIFLEMCRDSDDDTRKILIVQGQVNPETPHSLVECARYAILNQVQQHQEMTRPSSIILVLQVPRIYGGFFSGFPGAQWKALHIDELCGDPNGFNVADWSNNTLYQVLESDKNINIRHLIADCIPKAASIAYQSDDLSSARVVDCVEIMTRCFAENDQVKYWPTVNFFNISYINR